MAQAPIGIVMNMPDRQIDGIVTLNVGGTIFCTTRATLLKYPNSHLAVLVTNPNHIINRDKDGNMFIDRNGKTFEYILDFLRDEQNIPPRPVYRQVLQETSFYGISEHIQVASRQKNEVPDAQKIREKISTSVNYETLLHDIVHKGPQFLLIMEVTGMIYISTWLYQDYESAKTSNIQNRIGTGCVCLKDIFSETEARAVVSCLWHDLHSDGFDVDINIWGLRSYDRYNLYCAFTLRDIN